MAAPSTSGLQTAHCKLPTFLKVERQLRFTTLGLALAAACLSAASARTQGQVNEGFLTRPDIHGDQVVFTAEGDIWIADLKTGDATRLTSDSGIETAAHFSPDGSEIAFNASYDGGDDVYVMPIAGGIPKRLTYDPGRAVVQGWTPDGASVLFRTNSKLYAPAVEQFATAQLFTVPISGGMPKLIPVPRGSYASLNHDGHRLAYVPTSNEWMNWFRYEAGEADQIWLSDLATGKFTQLTNSNDVDTQPVWVGDTIYFISERSGVRNLWMLDPGTKRAKQVTFSTDVPVRYPSSDGHRVVFQLGPVLGIYDPATGKSSKLAIQLHSDRLHVRPYQAAVGQAEGAGLGPTGNRIVLATHGQLVTVPAKEGAMRELVTDSSQRVQFPAWSPDGKQIAYISDASGEEQIFLLGVGGDAVPKQLTRDLKGEHGPIVWSPDNKHLLVGDRAGDIQLVDAGSGAVTLVAHSQGTLEYDQIQTDFVFSPDSKWVAFSTSLGTDNSVAELYEISSGKVTQLSDPTINSQSPSFSMDGKFLYMLQDRSISMTEQGISHRISHDYESQVTAFTLASDTQSPYLPKEEDEAEVAKKPEEAAAKAAQTEAKKDIKIDIEGIADRYLDMKVPPGHYSAVLALPGKLLLQSPVGILSFDITTKTLAMVGPLLQIADATPDRKKLLVASPIGLQVIDAGGGPIPPGTGAVKLAGLTVTIDPAAQWRQMFFESWRVARDFFYDPKMLGIDWNAVKRKYEAELPMVGSRDDLSRIIADMISELNTGHAYVSGPTAYPAHAGRPGLLGIDLVRDTAAGAYKIKHILKGDTWNPEPRSPFAEPGVDVHEGDYLLKIRGTNLKENQDPAALLTGTAGQVISVTVNSKPTLVGARTVLVTPIASETELRLEDWVKSRREYVTKASGGQIGYVYMSDMEATGANQFAREYYPIVDKPGIIVDVRGNGGGFISGNILNDLDSKISGYFAFRAGGVYRREGWAPLGHVAALTNEFAFSDGEYFSEFFKRLKIGPLIGHRTGGGEVGSGGGYRLVDGGTVYIPNYGAFVPGEWVIEGRGAVPDIEVDQDPAAVMAGKDPQLDKAISVMLDEIKKEPVKLPVHPPYPVKLKGSRGG